jgi:hypothetical protein
MRRIACSQGREAWTEDALVSEEPPVALSTHPSSHGTPPHRLRAGILHRMYGLAATDRGRAHVLHLSRWSRVPLMDGKHFASGTEPAGARIQSKQACDRLRAEVVAMRGWSKNIISWDSAGDDKATGSE